VNETLRSLRRKCKERFLGLCDDVNDIADVVEKRVRERLTVENAVHSVKKTGEEYVLLIRKAAELGMELSDYLLSLQQEEEKRWEADEERRRQTSGCDYTTRSAQAVGASSGTAGRSTSCIPGVVPVPVEVEVQHGRNSSVIESVFRARAGDASCAGSSSVSPADGYESSYIVTGTASSSSSSAEPREGTVSSVWQWMEPGASISGSKVANRAVQAETAAQQPFRDRVAVCARGRPIPSRSASCDQRLLPNLWKQHGSGINLGNAAAAGGSAARSSSAVKLTAYQRYALEYGLGKEETRRQIADHARRGAETSTDEEGPLGSVISSIGSVFSFSSGATQRQVVKEDERSDRGAHVPSMCGVAASGSDRGEQYPRTLDPRSIFSMPAVYSRDQQPPSAGTADQTGFRGGGG